MCYNLDSYSPVNSGVEKNFLDTLRHLFMQKVTIYSTPTCQYCEQAKEYMKENEIDYKEYDVSSDAERRKEMIEQSGQMGVPVIVLGDDLMVGFEKDRFQQMVKAHENDDEE